MGESEGKRPRARTDARDPLVGTLLDRRFRIDERLASGGFGAIYRATHVKSGYRVAIKILHAHMSADARVVARFRREGATLTSLRDPHTVTTYELAEDANGTLFIVMELLQGETLEQRFRARGRMPWREAVAIARQVCDALVEAHGKGVVHRDLKPGNIFLTTGDVVKVLDFGIAKLMSSSEIADANDDLTRNNEVVGTYDYISPEQIKGSAYSGRSDLYTLGAVMYEMVTGERPFRSAAGTALLVAILNERPEPPSARWPEIPGDLDRLIARCLEPEPDARFPDAGALAAALDDLLGRPSSAMAAVHVPESDDEATSVRAVPPPPYATPFPIPPAVVESKIKTLEGWQAPIAPGTIPPVWQAPPPAPPSMNRLWIAVVIVAAISIGVALALAI